MAIGPILKEARERKGFTVQRVVEATNLMTKTILALEVDDYSVLPGSPYAQGFIRLYAKYVGLDPQPLISDYLATYKTFMETPVCKEPSLEKQRTSVARDTQRKSIFKTLTSTEPLPSSDVDTSDTSEKMMTSEHVAPTSSILTTRSLFEGQVSPDTQSMNTKPATKDDLFDHEERERRAILFSHAPAQGIFTTTISQNNHSAESSQNEAKFPHKARQVFKSAWKHMSSLSIPEYSEYGSLSKYPRKLIIKKVLWTFFIVLSVTLFALSVRMVYRITQESEPSGSEAIVPEQINATFHVEPVSTPPPPLIQ